MPGLWMARRNVVGLAVIVAHRHGAFAQCDIVYVMEGGRPTPATRGKSKQPLRQIQRSDQQLSDKPSAVPKKSVTTQETPVEKISEARQETQHHMPSMEQQIAAAVARITKVRIQEESKVYGPSGLIAKGSDPLGDSWCSWGGRFLNSRLGRKKFSAGRGLILGFGGSAVLIAGVFVWSVMASVSGAVIATGVVGVESRNQSIEHIDGGTISEILVRDGDRVEQNQVLFLFSDEKLRSEKAILLSQYVSLVAWRNRLEAEFHGENTIKWDEDLIKLIEQNSDFRKVREGQERLFRSRIAARNGEINQLREKIGQAHNEIRGLESRNESLIQQNELIAQELGAERKLFEQGLSRLPRLLAVERAAENLDGLVASNEASIARIRGSIAELEVQILLIDLRRIEEAEEQARDVSSLENQTKEQLDAVTAQLNRLEVKSPVAGVIFGMTVFAPGEVVFPGEPILQIVPEDTPLVVLAKVNPIDVDQIYLKQEAILRFSAFPARETPEFIGHVVRVSADVVLDETSGISYYEVELVVDRPFPDNDEQLADADFSFRSLNGLTITPGMPVEVHIRTIERTVISYLLKPVSDFFYRSFREE